jgi:hypothetical protein
MTLPAVDTYADLALAKAAGDRGHRRRIALLLWWPALALVIVLAEWLHWNAIEGILAAGGLWTLLAVYSEVRR